MEADIRRQGKTMRVSIVEDHRLPGIFLRLTGMFSVEHSIEVQRRVRGLALYCDGIAILNDYTDVNVKDLSTNDVRALSQAPRPGLRQRRAALVHARELGFGFARASATSDGLNGMETEAFRTNAEALAWLFPDQGLTEIPAEVDRIHTTRLSTTRTSDPEFELFVDNIAAAAT